MCSNTSGKKIHLDSAFMSTSVSGFTPVNQVRLTNVAYVRYQKMGKRFEIACYRNKVVNWRAKTESDIKQVLQIDTVFSNVARGQLANSKDLLEVFGTLENYTICREILDKGVVQVSEQERTAQYDSMFRDIAAIVTEKTVNPETNRPYTASIIQNAMKQIHYSVSITNKSAKQQALDVIRRLKNVMPIVRTNIVLRVIAPLAVAQQIRRYLFYSRGKLGVSKRLVCVEYGGIDNNGNIIASTIARAPAGSAFDNDEVQCANESQSYWDVVCDPEIYHRLESIVSRGAEAGNGAIAAAGLCRVEVLKLKDTTSISKLNDSSDEESESPTMKPVKKVASDTVASVEGDSANVDVELEDSEGLDEEVRVPSGFADLSILNEDSEPCISDSSPECSDSEYVLVHHDDRNGERKSRKERQKEERLARNESLFMYQRSFAAQNEPFDPESMIPPPAVVESKTDEKSKVGDKRSKKAKKLEKEILEEKASKREKELARVEAQKHRQKVVQTLLPPPVPASTAVKPVEKSYATLLPSAPSLGQRVSEPSAAVRTCNTCGGSYADAADYREHFKSNWHRYNLKQKMLIGNTPPGAPPAGRIVSLEEFNDIPFEDLNL